MSDTPEILEVTISRKRWLRAEGPKLSFLLRRADRKMCCIGSVALAAGLKEEDIEGQQALRDVDQSKIDNAHPALCRLTGRCELLMAYSTNDSTNGERGPDLEREKRIIELLAPIGIKVVFKD